MIIKTKKKKVKGEINLPASKSISNRVLIIHGIANSFEPINNLSNSDDTKTMFNVLFSNDNKFDIKDAGTCMRFLTAYLSGIIGKWEITGSERMQQRPIGELVDALNSAGAQIEYLEKEGYPPLKILGSNLTNNTIKLKGSISSQFISALLLIAPRFKTGLTIEVEGNITSRSYIDMTLSIMAEYGLKSSFVNNTIKVEAGNYETMEYTVESDWSAASYMYECVALAEKGKMKLNGLKKTSFQGDIKQVELWEKLGVKTNFTRKGVFIAKSDVLIENLNHDFKDMPDLAQTFAVTCCALNIAFSFTGLETLKIKETDRIEALKIELAKLGYTLNDDKAGELSWDGTRGKIASSIVIDPYGDHRMAMSFAPLALVRENILINNFEVVSKSYPNFWEDLKSLNFSCEEF
ncbi:MAG: 3-phosphoshikimate 1-carboxyvinyltransferase [Marinifilaceae bacterium]